MVYTSELISRVLRDIADSVLALDGRGRIIYMNPQCQSLLNLNDNGLGRTYAEVLFDEEKAENDSFHQFIVDAVLEKEQVHSGTVTYTDKHNRKMYLKITASFLKSEDEQQSGGVVLVLSDVTETETLKRKRYDASIVFSVITCYTCLYLLMVASLEYLKIYVPVKALTQVSNAIACLFGVIIYKTTDFDFEDLGLKLRNPRKTLRTSLGISLIVVLIMIAAKLIILKLSPDFFAADTPFWNWNLGLYSWCVYVLTSILQEFLARGLIYESIKKMFDGKRSAVMAIVLSSLLFGAVHLAHGFMYMMAAIVLMGAFGWVYEKQRNIWGVAILHYVLGQAAHCLGFLA